MYRGWSITGTTIATQAAQAGLLIYGFSALALPLEQEFGAPRDQVMLAATCLSLASSGFAPVAGWLIDRGSVRRLMLVGAAMLGAGFALMSVASQLWHVWAVYLLILPLGNVLLGQMCSATLITRWFARRRGRAMGISTMGTSLGGFVFPVTIAALAQEWGWRAGAATVGIATALMVAVLVFFMVRDRPGDDTDTGDEFAVAADSAYAAAAAAPALSARQLLATAAFWIITFAVGIKVATYFAMINNLAGLATKMGLTTVFAASMVSVLSLTSLAGKPTFGTLAELLAPKWLFFIGMVMTIACFIGLLYAQSSTALVVVCLFMGLSTGGILPLQGLIMADMFGQASYGRALGLHNLAMVPLTASASPLAGLAFERTGNYDLAIWGAIGALTIATGALLFVPSHRRMEAAA